MDSKQTKTLLGVFAFVVFAWLISPLLLSRREPAQPPSTSALSFDAARAYAATDEFVSQFPRRVLGSLESRQSTGYLHDCLQKMGYTIGGALAGWLLAYYGFKANVIQTQATQNGIRLLISVIPAVGSALAAITAIFYTLDESTMKKIEEELTERKKGQ